MSLEGWFPSGTAVAATMTGELESNYSICGTMLPFPFTMNSEET